MKRLLLAKIWRDGVFNASSHHFNASSLQRSGAQLWIYLLLSSNNIYCRPGSCKAYLYNIGDDNLWLPDDSDLGRRLESDSNNDAVLLRYPQRADTWKKNLWKYMYLMPQNQHSDR